MEQYTFIIPLLCALSCLFILWFASAPTQKSSQQLAPTASQVAKEIIRIQQEEDARVDIITVCLQETRRYKVYKWDKVKVKTNEVISSEINIVFTVEQFKLYEHLFIGTQDIITEFEYDRKKYIMCSKDDFVKQHKAIVPFA